MSPPFTCVGILQTTSSALLNTMLRILSGNAASAGLFIVLLTAPICCRAAAPDHQTTRIVSLVPNLTELTFALGAGSQIVGVSDFCRYPAEAKQRPSVGGLVNPGLEATLRLRPDVVFLYRSQTEFAGRLRQLGIKSELFQVDTLADLDAAIMRVGLVTGMTSASAALNLDIRRGLAQIRGQTTAGSNPSAAPPVPGLLIVSRDKGNLREMYQASEDNFLGELFKIAGGEIAVTGGAPVSREKVLRANPQVIIDMSSGEEAATATAPSRTTRPWEELSTVAAVKSGQVYQWPDSHAMLLGPGVVTTALQMQKLLQTARQAYQK